MLILCSDEAGFDVLVGNEDFKVASAQYTERAFVMSKGFIKGAFEHPLKGITDIIDWLYLSSQPGPHLLRQVVEESDDIIRQGASDSDKDGSALRLSAGASMLLQRTVSWLETRLREDEELVRGAAV